MLIPSEDLLQMVAEFKLAFYPLRKSEGPSKPNPIGNG